MQNKTPITEARYKQLVELEEYTNAVLIISATAKDLINELFKKHKEANVNIELRERIAWRKIRDGAASLDSIAFDTGSNNYKKFKKSVLMVKFLMLELIAHCDDSNKRVWEFHNLLKSFKLVYPAIAPTIEDEAKAFADLFEQTDK